MIDEWEIKEIDEVCDEIIDCINKTAPKVDYETEFKMLRTTNVRDGWVNTKDVKFVEKDIYKKWIRRGKPKKGDIILTREAPLGEVGMLKTNEKVFLGQRLVMYRANPEKLDNRFLLYSMQDRFMQSQISAYGSGSTVEHMRVPHCKQLEIKLPPLDIQRKIGSTLADFDDLIENNTRRIEILEEMARLIYREWFVHYRYPGHENDKLVDSGTDLGEIPEGWEVKELDEFGRIETGKTPRKKDPENYGDFMPFIKTPDMHDQFFVINTSDNLSKIGSDSQKKKTLPPNSICVSCIGTAGVVALTSVPSQTNQQINSLILQSTSLREFLYYAIKNLKPLMEKIGSTGATMTNVSKGKFQKLEVLYPGDDLVNKYSNNVASLFDQIQILEKQNIKLKKSRDLLLPKLISGKLLSSIQ